MELLTLGPSRYLILPVVFGRRGEGLKVDKTGSVVFSLFFIALSYTASAVIVFCQWKRKLFLLRALFMSVAIWSRAWGHTDADESRPHLIVNLIALFNVLLNVLARDLLPLNAIRVAGVGLPSAFSVIYGLAACLVYFEYESSRGHRAEDGTPLLSQEEMQRRQLLRLLQEQNTGTHTPRAVDNTYRLDGFNVGLNPVPKTGAQSFSTSAFRT